MAIREVTPEDLNKPGYLVEMVALGKLVHESSAYKHLPFDPGVLALQLESCVLDDEGLVVAAERNGKLIGGLVADIVPFFYSQAKEAIESIIFIHPDYSHTLDGPKLISAYVKWAKANNCAHISLGHSAGFEKGHKLGEYLIRRHGFKEAGVLYRIENEVA